MIKGIYNENEFYTNFYWDNKFAEDLRGKLGDAPSIESSVSALKALDVRYWVLKETTDANDFKHRLQGFYSAMFGALGYQVKTEEQQTADGELYSTLVCAKKNNAPELIALLTDQVEAGSFESTPLFLGASSRAET